MEPMTRQTGVPPANNMEEVDEQMDDSTVPTKARQNIGKVTGEEGVRFAERLVQTTLQFRAESAEQVSNRLEEERSTTERRRLRPPANNKKNQPAMAPAKPDKGNNVETKGSPEALRHWGGSMPKTENLDPEKMQSEQPHTIKFLTWNI
ncbi:hypothetical protein CYMTET_12982 [Cymbomonas tetramitiformis]|uniref:Uncharacterized protein n=1 Tax=Cymbomonas tetramitiformis TaxID=36881 RepID=A0AAE0GJ01_9CHLO|nr:hypothetical protein CYMTET_12982 [Cymbomonas tetramitiformis]